MAKDKIHQTVQSTLDEAVANFAAMITAQGYCSHTVENYARNARRFAAKVECSGVPLVKLDDQTAEELISQITTQICASGRSHVKYQMERFRDYLIAEYGAPPREPAPIDMSPRAVLCREYQTYLRLQRGLSEDSIYHCLRFFDRFLTAKFGTGLGDLNTIKPDDITGFILRLREALKCATRPVRSFTSAQTGLRVSEVIGLRVRDVELGTGPHLRCMGKGRKERATPLRADSRDALKGWLAQCRTEPSDPLFATIRGRPLSRDAVERIVRKHAATAASTSSTFRLKRVTPHVLRHTAALQLLQGGVDRTIIALWLGHESVETTQVYIHADIELKERAMALTKPVDSTGGRYRPGGELLAFLEAL